MKKLFILLFILIAAVGLFAGGSSEPTADVSQARATEQSMQEANSQIGMPSIINFQERKLMKMILELRDRADLVTFAYIVNLNGDLIYLGQCIGYGLPYSVQYTNPMKVGGYSSSYYTIPQPDPNGLYMPDGLSATWLMLIDPSTGDAKPVYIEPEILVSPFRLH